MFPVGKVFYRVSWATLGGSRFLFVTHYYIDRNDESGNDLRFRELVRIDGEWRISSTDTVFGDGTESEVPKFLVTKDELAARITEVMANHWQ